MNYNRLTLTIILLTSLLISQFPIELKPNEISTPVYFNTNSDTEYLLTISAKSNTNWANTESESATLVVVIDSNWYNYNQDIILYAGQEIHHYKTSLGPITSGNHSIQFKFDKIKSSLGSNLIIIDSIELTDINNIDIDQDVIKHSPILYGRDLLSWNESTHTDIPLIMWHDVIEEGGNKRITYSIIFSNEDSRIGVGLSDLMYSYGRTTDIEWVYEVLLSSNGTILDEIFQGASHITTNFQGNKIGHHPILKNATLNCNFSDFGISDFKFFLSPTLSISNQHTREILMDENPWAYRIMAEELINEQRYEYPANPETVLLSDVRNYLYIEFSGSTYGENIYLELATNFIGSCKTYINNHNYSDFNYNFHGGINRTSIELPEDFDPSKLHQLGFISSSNGNYNINLNSISRLFYLDNNYYPINLNINFHPTILNNANLEKWFEVNNNLENIDCSGIINGTSICDDCNICNGNNEDVDQCGICFGNNTNLDCNGECFGSSYLDECNICDDNIENDNSTCSGCTDINAENFDENAIFDDSTCIYSDNIFYVPNEYISIQDAIYYSSNNDTIEVGPGTYYENLNFMGKALTLRSQYENINDISNFIISGVDSSSTITIENIDDNISIIGFTITNGYGRGTSFEDFISLAANPEMLDSLLTNVLKGGGISISNANPHLKDLHINGNTARNVGAGIGLINSDALIESCIISNNVITDGDALGGGGIAINGGNPTIVDATIENNYVGSNIYSLNGGGGILCGFSIGDESLRLDMDNVNIIGNIANIGAGIGALSGIITANHILIASNSGDYGSTISLGEPLGLAIENITMNIKNSTLAHNSGLIGIGMINSAYLNAVNTIFWDNGDINFSPLPNNEQLNLNLNYCNSINEWPGQNNITEDPLFFNVQNSNFSLNLNSPCIDAGTNDTNMDGNIDIDSYSGTAPDIGKFEFTESCNDQIGDLNIDSSINILDIIYLTNCILSSNCNTCSDVNNDNQINILDIISLVSIILNL